MNRHERLLAALTPGATPDRVPVSAWGHWYDRETSAERFADIMVEFQQAYDWDFCKLHARASYHVEGWGFRYEASTDPAKGHVTLGHPIREAADWRKLRPLPLTTPAFQEQLDAIARVRRALPSGVPVIMTVFLPLDVADKLVDRDGELIRRHLREDEDAVRSALAVFAETFAGFTRAVAAAGVDGIYFSTKWANARRMDTDLYARLARPFDLEVIEAGRGLPCNILHLCEDAVDLPCLADYPVAAFHWDMQTPRNPSMARGLAMLGERSAVGGGVGVRTLAEGSPAEIHMQARDAIRQTGGRRFILGPGCSILTARTPPGNLRALRAAAEA